MFSKKEYVYAVYTEKSFTKAAGKLYISQPCLSAAIKKVEEKMGMPIFERRYSDVRLTPAGEQYIETAEKIMALENSFLCKVGDIKSLEYGSITVGGSNYVCSYILPQIVGAFAKKHPKIDIEIVETSSVDLERKIAAEEVDIIIDSFDMEKDSLECTPLLDEYILLAVPSKAPSNKGLEGFRTTPEEIYSACKSIDRIPELDIGHFRDERFILLKSGNSMYRHAQSVFRGCGFAPVVSFRLDQLQTSYALTASGNGVSFVTDTLFRYHLFRDSVCLYKVKNSGRRTLYAARKRGRFNSAAMTAFVDSAKETIEETVKDTIN